MFLDVQNSGTKSVHRPEMLRLHKYVCFLINAPISPQIRIFMFLDVQNSGETKSVHQPTNA